MATVTDTHTLKVNRFEIMIRPGRLNGVIVEHQRLHGREWTWHRDMASGFVTFHSLTDSKIGPPPRYVCNTLYTALCEKGFVDRGY